MLSMVASERKEHRNSTLIPVENQKKKKEASLRFLAYKVKEFILYFDKIYQ